MVVLELVSQQVDFHLIVRKAGLQNLSMREQSIWEENILTMIQNLTIKNDYSVRVEVLSSGVMISTNT